MKVRRWFAFACALIVFTMAGASVAQTADLVKNIAPEDGSTVYSSYPTNFTATSNNLIVFSAAVDGDYLNSKQPWRSDGTTAGTLQLSAVKQPHTFVAVDDLVFFLASEDGFGNGYWYVTNGTFGGTRLLSATLPVAESDAWGIGYKGHMYFPVNDATYGNELWRSDGSATYLFENIVPDDYSWHNVIGVDPTNPIICGDDLYFWGNYNDGSGTHTGGLYRTDGAGVDLVAQMHYYTAAEPWHFDQACYNNNLYFAGQASTDWTNIELYKYNSTTGSVTMLKDIMDDGNADPGANGDSDPDDLTPCNGLLFFTAQDADHGRELWVTDGTTANTTMLMDLNGTATDSYYGDFYCYNNTLFFRAAPTATGYQQIYTSDGTVSGTVTAGIQPRLGTGSWGPRWLTHDGVLYFRGIDNWASPTKDYAVYKYENGVATKLEGVFPSEMSSCGDKILINYGSTEYGNELYSLNLQSGVVGSGALSPMILLLER